MVDSEAIQTVVTQAAIQAATAAVMVMTEADAGPTSGTNTVGSGEACRQVHGRPALRQPSFNQNASNKQMKLLSFEMQITDILWTKTYALTNEDKVPVITNWRGRKDGN